MMMMMMMKNRQTQYMMMMMMIKNTQMHKPSMNSFEALQPPSRLDVPHTLRGR